MTKKTIDNTQPSSDKYMDAKLHAIIGELGQKFLEMRQLLDTKDGTWNFDHREYVWLGTLPVFYDDEVIGYFMFEDETVNFYEAELKDEK